MRLRANSCSVIGFVHLELLPGNMVRIRVRCSQHVGKKDPVTVRSRVAKSKLGAWWTVCSLYCSMASALSIVKSFE